MRYLLILTLVIAILLTIALGAHFAEGFASGAPAPDGNYAVDLVKRLLVVSKRLANPVMWKERIDMIGKSPVDMARAYMKSQSK
jgi:hypothetical protein